MFATKYPAFAALMALVAAGVQDATASNETLVQKLEGSVMLVPQALAFFPQASLLGSELTALKANPIDLEAGAELLVTDLAFTSAKAKAIVSAAFPVAESLAAMVPQVQALITVIKS